MGGLLSLKAMPKSCAQKKYLSAVLKRACAARISYSAEGCAI